MAKRVPLADVFANFMRHKCLAFLEGAWDCVRVWRIEDSRADCERDTAPTDRAPGSRIRLPGRGAGVHIEAGARQDAGLRRREGAARRRLQVGLERGVVAGDLQERLGLGRLLALCAGSDEL
jgi:hypothetical protein